MGVVREVVFPNIDPSELSELTPITKGSFGTIFKCFYQPFGTVTLKFSEGKKKADVADLRKEFDFLVRYGTCHPNIVQAYGLVDDPYDGPGILLEYVAGGTLEELLYREDLVYNVDHIVHWMVQMASAVSYIHSCDVIHRDLKPANVLLDRSYSTVKLCDFGFARKVEDEMSLQVGSWCWMAPEVMKETGKFEIEYDEKCDVYSLGIILWQLIAREKPFDRVAVANHIELIIEVGKGLRPPHLGCITELEALYTWSWEPVPAARISSKELRNTLQEMQKIHSEGWMPLIETDSQSLLKPLGCFIENTALEDVRPKHEKKAEFLKTLQSSRRAHTMRFFEASHNPNNTADYIVLSGIHEEPKPTTEGDQTTVHDDGRHASHDNFEMMEQTSPQMQGISLPNVIELPSTPPSTDPPSFIHSEPDVAGEVLSESFLKDSVYEDSDYEDALDTHFHDANEDATDDEFYSEQPLQVFYPEGVPVSDEDTEMNNFTIQGFNTSVHSTQSDHSDTPSCRSVDTVINTGNHATSAEVSQEQQGPNELPTSQYSMWSPASSVNSESQSSLASGPSGVKVSPFAHRGSRYSVEDSIIKGKMGSRDFDGGESVKYSAKLVDVETNCNETANQRDWEVRDGVAYSVVKKTTNNEEAEETLPHSKSESFNPQGSFFQERPQQLTNQRTSWNSGSTNSVNSLNSPGLGLYKALEQKERSARRVGFDVPPQPETPVACSVHPRLQRRVEKLHQTPSLPPSPRSIRERNEEGGNYRHITRSTRVRKEDYDFDERKKKIEEFLANNPKPK